MQIFIGFTTTYIRNILIGYDMVNHPFPYNFPRSRLLGDFNLLLVLGTTSSLPSQVAT
jgi:hypothetical protein